MKSRILGVLVFGSMLGMSAQARYVGPILSRTISTSGAPAYVTSKTCRVYSDKVQVVKIAGGVVSAEEVRPVKLTGNIAELTDAAALGQIVEEPAPVGAGLMTYMAYGVLPNDAPDAIDLGAVYRSAGKKTVNKSEAAATLRNFLDLICD